MNAKQYVIVIKRSPEQPHQTYRGWDHVYTDRKEALAAVARAKQQFMSAKLRTV